MNKKLITAGAVTGAAVGTIAGAMIIKREKGKQNMVTKHMTPEAVYKKVDKGGDTKPGMERQIYRDLFQFLMEYGDTELEDIIFDDFHIEENVEAYASEFAKKTAEYIDSAMVEVRNVTGRMNDGEVIDDMDSRELFPGKACRIAFLENEQVWMVPIERYTELWYSENGIFYVVNRVDFKGNFNVTYRFISSCSEFEPSLEYPITCLKRDLDSFATMCETEKALEAL